MLIVAFWHHTSIWTSAGGQTGTDQLINETINNWSADVCFPSETQTYLKSWNEKFIYDSKKIH